MRQLPDIDASQDWQLSNSSKDKSHVLIEMHRKLVTCDSNDIDITVRIETPILYSLTSYSGTNE